MGLDVLDRARRMDACAELTGHALISESEFCWVYAGAQRLMNRADRLGFVDEVAPQFRRRDDTRAVPEDVIQHFRFGRDAFKAALAVCQVKMPTALRFAIDLCNQVFERFESFRHLGMHSQRDIAAPACDPLRARQASGRILRLAAIAGASAPCHLVCLQHGGLHSKFACEIDRTR